MKREPADGEEDGEGIPQVGKDALRGTAQEGDRLQGGLHKWVHGAVVATVSWREGVMAATSRWEGAAAPEHRR